MFAIYIYSATQALLFFDFFAYKNVNIFLILYPFFGVGVENGIFIEFTIN